MDGVYFITKRTDAETLDILFNAWHCQLMVSSFPSFSTCTVSRDRRTALGSQPTNTRAVYSRWITFVWEVAAAFSRLCSLGMMLLRVAVHLKSTSFPSMFIHRFHLQFPAFAKVDVPSMTDLGLERKVNAHF